MDTQEYQTKIKSAYAQFEQGEQHLKALSTQLQETQGLLRQVETQWTENTMVKAELDRLEEEAVVYKLIGPLLIKQDREEAIATVQQRLGYIEDEKTRLATKAKEESEKAQQTQSQLMQLQQHMHQLRNQAIQSQQAQMQSMQQQALERQQQQQQQQGKGEAKE